jgi:hypothetical protein
VSRRGPVKTDTLAAIIVIGARRGREEEEVSNSISHCTGAFG